MKGMAHLSNYVVRRDPTEIRCFGIEAHYEYDPHEFASVWVARELDEEHATLFAAAPDLIAAAKQAIVAMRRTYEVVEWPADGNSPCDAAIRFLEMAISKAEGSAS